MAEIPHERDFLVWIILNFVQKSVRKHYVTRLIDFASKLYDVEKFLILFCHLLLKIALFY